MGGGADDHWREGGFDADGVKNPERERAGRGPVVSLMARPLTVGVLCLGQPGHGVRRGPHAPAAAGHADGHHGGVNPDGSITLRWKAVNAAPTSGAFFSITRRLGASAAFVGIGGASGGPRGFSAFTDETLPAGATATYIIQGFRGTVAGAASPAVTVQLGVHGPGLSVSGAGAWWG